MKYVILLLGILSLSLSAQLPDPSLKPDEMPAMDKEATDDAARTGTFHTRTLPQWSIKTEVSTIEKSLHNYDPLIQSLEEANGDLKTDLAEYLKSPGDEVLAAKITAKMSKYAKKIVQNVDTITADQDNLLSVFSELNQKLDKFSGYLDFQVVELDKEVKKYQDEAKILEQQLKAVAKKWKSAESAEEKEKYRQEFRRIYNKYNINTRYKDGFARNRADYEVLAKNLKDLMKIFKILNQAFDALIENLAAERKYLLDNIRLQADAIRVQSLVREGISDGSRAVVQITKKLALVYAQVEGFAKVHEKINRDMAKFSDSTKILGSLVQQIEQTPFQAAPSLDKAMEYFANTPD